MSWPTEAAPAVAGREMRVASMGTGGGGVGGRRVPEVGGLGKGAATVGRGGDIEPSLGGWLERPGCAVLSWSDGRGGGGRFAAAGGELHLP